MLAGVLARLRWLVYVGPVSSEPSADAPPDFDDSALLERLRAGDEAACAEVVHLHSGRIFAIGMSMLRNEQDARDVVQETFLNAFRKLDGFRGDAPFGSWLKRIATNSALMKLRRRRRKPETSLDLPPSDGSSEGRERDLVDPRPLSDKLQEDAELGQRIRLAVDGLSDSYREVLVLADYQELSMREIAEILEITVPNVKTRLHRARLAVRAALQGYLAGTE
jgi:RNA polymerase sigma-70 factor, ECF subfamily